MNAFVHALTAAASQNTTTENGAVAKSTTGSAVLNLFSQIGGLRNNQERCAELVTAALAEDAELTARCIFYSRDVRGGQGERQTFRTNMRILINADPRAKALIKFIPTYGRFDDVVELMDVAPVECMDLISTQLKADLISESPSLLAKWLPSENASSKVSKTQALMIRFNLKMSSREYRKTLSFLRKKLNVVECKMSAGQFNEIEFGHVPSNAMLLYRNAFSRQVPEQFCAYLESVKKGTEKINAGTLFPYDLVGKYLAAYGATADPVIEEQWKAQIDYFNGHTENSLVVCDVSGSMTGMPMNVSISLGIYVAERNRGIWHNKFMTFSSNPTMQSLKGNTLYEKVRNLAAADWGMNTNIEATFDAILKAAVASNIAPAEMITRLYLVSDMNFDAANKGHDNDTLFDTIRAKFTAKGYTMPELLFWNVASRNTQFPMALDARGFLNVSGCSPSIFKFTLGKTFISAYDMMLSVINSDRYSSINLK